MYESANNLELPKQFWKNNKVGRLKLPDWKTYYEATELRQGCFGKRITCKPMEQNKISEMDSNIIGSLIFDKRAKEIQRRKVLSFGTNGAGTVGYVQH